MSPDEKHAEVLEHRKGCPVWQQGKACEVCSCEHCGWCPECHPEVPEWN